MRTLERGQRPPESRKGRARLSVRDPLVEALLGGLSDSENLDDVRAFCKRMTRERNAWSIANHGLRSFRQLSFREAERELRARLADLKSGGATR